MSFKTLEDVLDRLKTFEGSPMLNKITEIDKDNFKSRDGKFIYDNILSDMDFLLKYVVLERSKSSNVLEKDCVYPRLNRKYKKYFDAMKQFVIYFKVAEEIPYSFFNFKYIKIIYVWNYSDEDESLRVVNEVVEREQNDEDFLGLEGGIMFRYNKSRTSDMYFSKIKDKFSKKEIVRRYRHWLNNVPLNGKLSEMDYSTPYDFINVFVNQFGLYWEVMLKFKRENPNRKVFIRNDGLGAISMMCIALEIPYRSVEIYGIGEVAFKLGIIKSQDVTYEREKDEVEVLANLSTYIDISSYTDGEYVVIDENRLYTGIKIKDSKKTSKMRVTSNVLSDTFLNAGDEISKAKPMIEKKKNVPIDAKAEAFLLMSNIPVYTDGVVETKTPSIKLDDKKDMCYVLTSENRIKETNDLTCYYLNIVNRNVPLNWRIGKFGEVKMYRNKTFVYAGEEVVVNDDFFSNTIKLSRYKDPYELKGWRSDGFFIVGYSDNPASKSFYVDRGVKKYIIFLNSIFDCNGYRLDVYQKKDDTTVLNSEIVGVL